MPTTQLATNKKRITFDFETRSMCDLKKAGAYKYSLDPTTRPTCLAFKIWGDPVPILFDFCSINRRFSEYPTSFRKLWHSYIEEGFEFSAHNAFFERCMYENILVTRLGWPSIPFESYRCTAAKAAACALPRALGAANEAMKLSVQKDFRGYQAMMATCKPTKQWLKWQKKQIGPEPPVFLEPEVAPEVFDVLYRYCKIDVLAEENLDDALPDLIPEEQEIWHLNQKLNWRGLKIDVPTVTKIVDIMQTEGKQKLKELDNLTMGLVTKPGARNSILEFLELEGVKLENLQKKTVEDKLGGDDLSIDMRRLLELRQALSLTSTKKYQSFLHRACEDYRVRDILLYHGASTGRDTGTGIQPHNFPRGVIRVSKERPYAAVENVIECDHELLKILYGDSLGMVFSSILRNMITASEDHELFVADYSKIEVAVLWWLAGNEAGLKILREGKDPYLYQAAANLGKRYEDLDPSDPARDLGKAQTLGCGFGMGWEKFKETAWAMHRLRLTDAQAQAAISAYRTTNPTVPQLWKDYEAAAIMAIESKLDFVSRSRCRFFIKDDFLWVQLPSGRRLAYREPRISWRETEYGPRKTLEFWAVNSKTKKWGMERTWGGTLTENIVQAVARDLLMQGIVRLEKAGYKALLTVHDEAICEREIGTGTVEEFSTILCETPWWAPGLPVEAKGWKGPRYRK